MAEHLYGHLRRLPIWQRSLIVTCFAIAGSDLLTLAFYSAFFADRLVLDLILTAIIAATVAFPTSMILFGQAAKVEQLAEELNRAARTDYLTRLANRREFMTATDAFLKGAGPAGALLFIDADRFKQVNDTYGHAAGDKVLVELANIIGLVVRQRDVAARIGGEEFAVFLRQADAGVAFDVAEQIRMHAHEAGSAAGLPADAVSVSIGVAIHRPGQQLEDVLRAADHSLYVAKNNGRNMVVCGEALAVAA